MNRINARWLAHIFFSFRFVSNYFLYVIAAANMAAVAERDVVINNFILRLNTIVAHLEPLVHSTDPNVQLEHVMYQMDSMCRDILMVQERLSIPEEFVALVIASYQLLSSARHDISNDSVGTYERRPITERSGIGRPKLVITCQQLLLLLGMYFVIRTPSD